MKTRISKDFLFAGRSFFTVHNAEGTHYTYRVSYAGGGKDRSSPLFVSVLTGPDNTGSYTYMGILGKGGELKLTQKSKYHTSSPCVKVFVWAARKTMDQSPLPEGYEIHHLGKCGRCGRTLSTPESVAYGIGPECRTR